MTESRDDKDGQALIEQLRARFLIQGDEVWNDIGMIPEADRERAWWIPISQVEFDALARSSCPPAWIKVSERLPERANNVLAYFVNEFGHGRRIRAFYARQHQIEDTSDNGLEGAEEKDGTYYVSAGWYESNENDEYYYRVSCEVSHWMPLPDAPVPECPTINAGGQTPETVRSGPTAAGQSASAAPTEAPDWAKRANDYADEGFAFLRDKPTEAPALSREQVHSLALRPMDAWTSLEKMALLNMALSSLQPPAQGSAELVKALEAARDALYNGFEPDNQSRAYHAADTAIKTALSRQPSQQGPSEEEVQCAEFWKDSTGNWRIIARAILRWAEQSGRKP